MRRSGFVIVVAAALTLGAAGAKAECRTVVGSADMITADLAKFMADAALKNAIAAKGLKPAGPINLKCRDDAVTTYCKASRRACS
jgi:hypothetical protein